METIVLVPRQDQETFSDSRPVLDGDLMLESLENKIRHPVRRQPRIVPVATSDPEVVDDEDDEDQSDDSDEERQRLYFQYMVLKRMYPTEVIPEMTTYSNVAIMREKYKLLTRRLSLDKHINEWKKYIIVGMCIMELVMTKLNFDASGFARYQIKSLGAYDQLLAEMADKYYEATPQSSVEMRLMTTMVMNMAVFMLGKLLGGQMDFLGLLENAFGSSS
ncbi:Orf56L protein-like protein [Tiger frog virus]|uniref:Orf56L protein-like protein n=1 Tax=Rana tigrina ranavirus TaxID=160691 RepID=A0A6M8PSH7_RTRV|nr:Orf56L protein-like protein [Tiger frog virus]